MSEIHPYVDTSTIPNDELQYYSSEEGYYSDIAFPGTIFETRVVPFNERIQTSHPTKNGLYVPEVLMLSFCKDFPNPKRGYPAYWWFKYGVRNVGAMLASLQERGFIELNEINGKYEPTDLGRSELAENEYIAFTHKESQNRDVTPWEMNDYLFNNPSAHWTEIFAEKTGQLAPLRPDQIHITDLSAPLKPLPKRIPLNQIIFPEDNEAGHEQEKKAHRIFEEGELYRKAGDLYKAIELYDEARSLGYNPPGFYKSYATVLRKLKDYDNEIDLLEEIIPAESNGLKTDWFSKRREKAIQLRDKRNSKNH